MGFLLKIEVQATKSQVLLTRWALLRLIRDGQDFPWLEHVSKYLSVLTVVFQLRDFIQGTVFIQPKTTV